MAIGGNHSDDRIFDFFVLSTDDGEDWAVWLSWELSQAGYRLAPSLQEALAGEQQVAGLDARLRGARYVLGVVTDGFNGDNLVRASVDVVVSDAVERGEAGRFVPMLVEGHQSRRLLRQGFPVVLFGTTEQQARLRLLAAARNLVGGAPVGGARAGVVSVSQAAWRPRYPPDQSTAGRSARMWMAPPPRHELVERSGLAGTLMHAFDVRSVVGKTVLLHGAGGFGKTSLAEWTVRQRWVLDRYGDLLWVTLGRDATARTVADSINDLLTLLLGGLHSYTDPEPAVENLTEVLQSRGMPAVVVVDDVWDNALVQALRPLTRVGTLLLTARSAALELPGHIPVKVDTMEEAEARDVLLGDLAGVSAATVRQLIDRTGRWPLLLTLVRRAVIQRVQVDGHDPQAAAARLADRLLRYGPTAAEHRASYDLDDPEQRREAAAATIEASLELLSEADADAFTDLGAVPFGEAVPSSVLELLWPRRDADWLCEMLARLALVSEFSMGSSGEGLIRLHDVVHSYLRHRSDTVALTQQHARLVGVARSYLAPAPGPAAAAAPAGLGLTSWWSLPVEAEYFWRTLADHLAGAGRHAELTDLLLDLRWVEAKIARFGSVARVERDLSLLASPAVGELRRLLGQAANVLGPIVPDGYGAILVSRLGRSDLLASAVEAHSARLARPVLVTQRPMPDLADDPALVRVLGGQHRGTVRCVGFVPDRAGIITAGDDGTIRLWDVASGEVSAVLTGHVGGVNGIALSPDAGLVASAGADRTVRLWSLADRRLAAVLRGHGSWVRDVAFSPDGRLLASVGADQTVRLWDVAGRRALRTLTGHTNWVLDVEFSPDGLLLASASDDLTARLWEVSTGRCEQVLEGHQMRLMGVGFAGDGRTVATASDDRTVRLWDVASGECVATLTGHEAGVNTVTFSPDDTCVVAGADDYTIRVWDRATTHVKHVLRGHTDWVREVAFRPPDGRVRGPQDGGLLDDELLVSSSNDATARLWRLADAGPPEEPGSVRRHLWDVAFFAAGGQVAVARHDARAAVEPLGAAGRSVLLSGHAQGVNAVAVSPDDALLATASDDCTVRLWHARSGRLAEVLVGCDDWLNDVSFSPDAKRVAAGCDDGTTAVWTLPDGACTTLRHPGGRPVLAATFAPSGHRLAAAADDGTVALWDVVGSGVGSELVSSWPAHRAAVVDLAYSPGGELLASACQDTSVRVFDGETQDVVAVMSGHDDAVTGVSFASCGTVLASVGLDRCVRVWEARTGRCLAVMRVAQPLHACAWHPNAHSLVVAGAAGLYLFKYLT